jgi:DNA-directed RNA polymerase
MTTFTSEHEDELRSYMQLALEQEQIEAQGVIDSKLKYEAAVAKKYGTERDDVRQLINKMIEALEARLQQTFDEHAAATDNEGNLQLWFKLLRDVPMSTLAYIALADGLAAACSTRAKSTAESIKIGRSVEDHINVEAYLQQLIDTKGRSAGTAQFNRELSYGEREDHDYMRKRKMGMMASKLEEPATTWTDDDRARVGIFLLGELQQSTGYIEVELDTESLQKTPYVIALSDEGEKARTAINMICQALSQQYLPMIAPPRDWKVGQAGGYYTEDWQVPLVRKQSKTNSKYLELNPPVAMMESINVLQKVPYRINVRVLDVFEAMAEAFDVSTTGLPVNPDNDPELPDIETFEDAEYEIEATSRPSRTPSTRSRLARLLVWSRSTRNTGPTRNTQRSAGTSVRVWPPKTSARRIRLTARWLSKPSRSLDGSLTGTASGSRAHWIAGAACIRSRAT